MYIEEENKVGDGSERGMPGEFLLLFTLLLWILFLMVYLGNRKSKLNKWFLYAASCSA